MRIDIRHHALAAHQVIDDRMAEEVILRYKGQKIAWRAVYKKDQVESQDSAGNVAYVDREYLLVQDRFVLPGLSNFAAIERTDVFSAFGKQIQHYSVLNQTPLGNGWTLIHLKRERVSRRRGPTRNERYPTPDTDTDPASVPRSAR